MFKRLPILIALVCCAAMPYSSPQPPRVILHAQVAQGELEIIASPEGLCLVRHVGGQWHGPIDTASLGSEEATVGTTFCTETHMGPFGTVVFPAVHEVKHDTGNLAADVQSAAEEIADILSAPNTVVVPCPELVKD